MTEDILPAYLPDLLQGEYVHCRYAGFTLQCEYVCVHVLVHSPCIREVRRKPAQPYQVLEKLLREGGTVGSLRRPLGIKDRNAEPGRAKPSSVKGFH